MYSQQAIMTATLTMEEYSSQYAGGAKLRCFWGEGGIQATKASNYWQVQADEDSLSMVGLWVWLSGGSTLRWKLGWNSSD